MEIKIHKIDNNFSEKEIITKEKYLNKFIQNGFPGKKNEYWNNNY